MIKIWILVGIVVLGIANISTGKSNDHAKTPPNAKDQCISDHIYNSQSVDTARAAVYLHYLKKGQDRLAKYVTDREAVAIVYCHDK